MEENSGRQDVVDQILAHPDIGDVIYGFCDALQLNILRLVSKEIQDEVDRSMARKKNCRFKIGIQTMELPVTSEKPWRIVLVDLNPANIGVLKSKWMLTNVIDIQFVLSGPSTNQHVIDVMTRVLLATSNIENMGIDIKLMDIDLGPVLENLEIKTKLKNLKRLYFFPSTLSMEFEMFVPAVLGPNEPISTNFRLMTKMDWKLTSLQLTSIDIFSVGYPLRYVPGLISQSKDSLKQLFLYHDVWDFSAITTIICPNLNKLVITTYKHNADKVTTFIKNHKNLRHVYIHMKHGFSYSIYKAFEESSFNLNTLMIKADYLDGFPMEANWSFLKCCKNLKEFRFIQPKIFGQSIIPGIAANVLNGLPTETLQLKKIELRGIQKVWQQPGPTTLILPFEFKRDLLLPFKNVTHLSFLNSPNSVDDKLMQLICEHFLELRVLKVSHCDTLTNYGISGIDTSAKNMENTGHSLQSLKRLKRLVLKWCLGVRMDGLMGAVRMPDLEHLEVLVSGQITYPMVKRLCSRNQNLQTLGLRYPNEPPFENLQGLRTKLHSICPHLMNLFHVSEWHEPMDMDMQPFK